MNKASNRRIPIVGVGASAGGVEALEGFFRGLPPKPGLAVVVITHLTPARESHLPEIIARYTGLKVEVAAHDAELKADHVYVMPADTVLSVSGGKLKLAPNSVGRRERKPVDIFLSTLAKDAGEYSAAVVLSGGDGDGTLGVKAIKERGGMTLAQTQDGDGPTHPGMPDSAISTGFVDFPIPADQMGAKLVAFVENLRLLDGLGDTAGARDEASLGDAARAEIYKILRNQVGHDFSGYKTKTFLRRAQRRMQVAQTDTLDAYAALLKRDPREVNALFRDLLINVTNFFRDADAFNKLAEVVIPKLFENREDGAIRVWVPGCATGEEVYSIAMLLREHMDALDAKPPVQIFATDIDEHALNVARAARYPAALLDAVSPERLSRHFVQDGGAYVVSKTVRDLCIFSPHSVLRDPPFSRIDLVSCRNLLIYFGPDAQAQVIPTFHYSLRRGGYLFLGASENVTQYSDLFTALDKKNRIFQAKEDHLNITRVPFALRRTGEANAPAGMRAVPARGHAFRQALDAQVLDQFAPAHVVVNRDGDIVYYSSRTGKYLEPAPGPPTRQLFNLARKGLRLDLRSVFREAVEAASSIKRSHIEVEGDDGRLQLISVTVSPLVHAEGDEPLYVVLFEDQSAALTREDAVALRERNDKSGEEVDLELRETRERLQAVIEEYETALEELKSSNEELVSVNEEAQSTNEELEASKEELQSLNEELHTVNAELSSKVEALDAANDDLQNLFENTHIATIFLDRDLNIRNFTPASALLFSILPGDRGRPLTDLSSSLEIEAIESALRSAVERDVITERRLRHNKLDKHFMARIAPYRDSDRRTVGAVITFIDITPLVHAEAQHAALVAERAPSD